MSQQTPEPDADEVDDFDFEPLPEPDSEIQDDEEAPDA